VKRAISSLRHFGYRKCERAEEEETVHRESPKCEILKVVGERRHFDVSKFGTSGVPKTRNPGFSGIENLKVRNVKNREKAFRDTGIRHFGDPEDIRSEHFSV
jgi:hypothetical protein